MFFNEHEFLPNMGSLPDPPSGWIWVAMGILPCEEAQLDRIVPFWHQAQDLSPKLTAREVYSAPISYGV